MLCMRGLFMMEMMCCAVTAVCSAIKTNRADSLDNITISRENERGGGEREEGIIMQHQMNIFQKQTVESSEDDYRCAFCRREEVDADW